MSEKLTVAEWRKETGSGDSIKETPLSAQIAGLMNSLKLENDRIQSGKIKVVKEYTNRTDGKLKRFEHWMELSKKGTPDRWCLIHGKMVFVEVKTKGKKPTAVQLQRQAELIKAGAIVINVDSLQDAHEKLTRLKADLDPKKREKQLRMWLLDFLQSHQADIALKAVKEIYG